MAGPPNSSLPPNSPDVNGLRIGTRIGEFEVVQRIGEGGFSVVYLAWDHSLERNVALKEYMPMSIASRVDNTQIAPMTERHRETFDVALASFINEGKLLAQFDHPSLVKVYRFWEANGTAYMVMPFYEGRTLRDTIRSLEQPPDEAWLLALLQPLTKALSVIHAANCFHRDIAPDNVMLLARTGAPLLLDFGAARRVIGDRTQALTAILKPGYAPIEQYAEVPHLRQGSWTDVYALAAVIYWAIKGSTPPSAVGRMLKDSYVPLSEEGLDRYSHRFLQAIDRALKVLPEDRTQTIDAFRQDLGFDASAADQQAEPTSLLDSEATILRAPIKPASVPPRPSEATVFSGVPTSRPEPSALRETAPESPAEAAPVERAAAPVPSATPAPPPASAVPATPAARPITEAVAAARPFPVLASSLAAGSIAVVGLALWWWLQQPASAPPTVEVASIPAISPQPLPATPAVETPQPKTDTAPPSAPLPAPSAEPPPQAPVAIDVSSLRSPFQLGKDPLRFAVKADEAGYLYLFGHREGAADLQLLLPAGSKEAIELTAGREREVELPAKTLAAQSPGNWKLWVVVSRTSQGLNAADWGQAQKQFASKFNPLAENDQSANWVEPLCASSIGPCDRAIGVRKLALTTLAAPRPEIQPAAVPARTAPAPAPPVVQAKKPEPAAPAAEPAKPAQPAECARIIQRLSIGDGGAELAKRMVELGCR